MNTRRNDWEGLCKEEELHYMGQIPSVCRASAKRWLLKLQIHLDPGLGKVTLGLKLSGKAFCGLNTKCQFWKSWSCWEPELTEKSDNLKANTLAQSPAETDFPRLGLSRINKCVRLLWKSQVKTTEIWMTVSSLQGDIRYTITTWRGREREESQHYFWRLHPFIYSLVFYSILIILYLSKTSKAAWKC